MTIYPGFVLGQSSMVSGEDLVKAFNKLPADKKLPSSAIKDAVMSVNGKVGVVQITAQGINAQASSPTLSAISQTSWGSNAIMATDSSGQMVAVNYTSYAKQLLAMNSKQDLIDSLGLQPGQYPVSSVNGKMGSVEITAQDIGAASATQMAEMSNQLASKVSKGDSIPYSSLSDAPVIPNAQVNSDWNATSGVSAILNKPNIFDGNYDNLSNRPILFSGDYRDLSNRPVLFSGEYSDIIGKPNLSTVATSGSYSDLTNKPVIPAPQVSADWNATSGVSQILNKPALFSGNYADLSGKPSLFNGDYNSLTNKPIIPVVNYPVLSVNTKTGSVTLDHTDVGAAALQHTHTISDVAGLTDALASKLGNTETIPYSRLTGSPTIPAAQVQADWNQTNVSSLDYIKNKPSIPVINYPVTSVNGKTGAVALNSSDVGAASAVHTHNMGDITGLQNALDSKISVGASIAYSTLTGAPVIPTNTNQLTNGSGFVTSLQAASAAPVQSVNGKTGTIVLTASDIGAAATSSIPTNNSFTLKGLSDTDDVALANGFLRWNATGTSVTYSTTIPYSAITGVPALSAVATSGSYNDLTNTPVLFDGTWSSLSGKPTFASVATSGSYADLTNKPAIPAAQIQSNWTQTVTTALDYIKNKPALSTVAISGSYADLLNKPSLFDGTWNSLTGKPTFSTVATTGLYSDLTGRPTIPTATSQLTNDSGYLTTVPVTSVNTKTGAVTLAATDVGAAPSAQGTKYYRTAGTQATGMKVKYYSVTTDTNGAFTVSLGTDFTELLDVQAQAVSSMGVSGIRQVALNAYTSTSTSLTGQTYSNNAVTVVLGGLINGLALAPNTVVKLRCEGIGA